MLLRDFFIDLLKFNTFDQKKTFLDNVPSNSFHPQILLSTRVCKNIKILIDNIFCNIPNPLVKTSIFGNISSSISDYLPQYFTLPDFFPILYQLNITSCPMTGKTFANNYFLRILERNFFSIKQKQF